MPKIDIYTTNACGYCTAAKALLRQKNVTFTEINVAQNESERAVMMARSGGRRTLPQIFIGSTHVGGCDDIHALDAAGGLDTLLAAS
jgi:glutaredoxin 3